MEGEAEELSAAEKETLANMDAERQEERVRLRSLLRQQEAVPQEVVPQQARQDETRNRDNTDHGSELERGLAAFRVKDVFRVSGQEALRMVKEWGLNKTEKMLRKESKKEKLTNAESEIEQEGDRATENTEEEDSHARQLRPPGTPLRQETTMVACATPSRHQSTSPIGMSAAPPTFQLRAPDRGAPSWKTTTAGKVEPPPRNGWTCGTCLRTFATQGTPTRPLSTHTPHPCPRLKT